MSTEAQIRAKFLKHTDNQGFVWWWPYKRAIPIGPGRVTFLDQDIHNCWDGMGIRDSDIRFVQITSRDNMSARRRKIKAYFEEHSVFVPTEIWGWDAKKKEFKIEYL